MGWLIKCTLCDEESWVSNIVELLDDYCDRDGWFVCPSGHRGYIEKSFVLQEPGNRWEPFLRGAYRLGKKGDTYQPFVFFVSYEPAGPVSDVWFSYY